MENQAVFHSRYMRDIFPPRPGMTEENEKVDGMIEKIELLLAHRAKVEIYGCSWFLNKVLC